MREEKSDEISDEINSDMSESSEVMEEAVSVESDMDTPITEAVKIERLINQVEALVFSSAVPIPAEKIVKQLEDIKPLIGEVRACLGTLQKDYENRGVHLVEVATGWRFQVALECAPTIVKTLEEKPTRLSRALLETLALIAYRQPITRGEIESIRGVVVSSHMVRTLLEHEWVRVVGHKDVPGRPALFATTKTFLDDMGLSKLEELPPLSELKALMPDKVEAKEAVIDTEDGTKTVSEPELKPELESSEIDELAATNAIEEPVEPEVDIDGSIDIETTQEPVLEQSSEDALEVVLPQDTQVVEQTCDIKSALAGLRKSAEAITDENKDNHLENVDENTGIDSFKNLDRNLDDFSEIILTNPSTVSNHITDEVVNKDDNSDDEENNQECSA